jgi:hypothetical protein
VSCVFPTVVWQDGTQTLTRRQAIETALAAWREAERRHTQAVDGEREALQQQVERHRAEFQQLSADHMVERIGKLQEAESRRAHATPSTLPFHEAARETQEIAGVIWEAARHSDEDTPEAEANRRTTPRPTRRGAKSPAALDVEMGGHRATNRAVKRLIAIAMLLSACGGGGAYATAAPALVRTAPGVDAIAQFAALPETVTGVITFGIAYDPDTLGIPRPLTRFKRTYPVIAWSADLARGVTATFVTWLVVRQSKSGVEKIVFDVEEPIDDASVTTLANSADLALLVDNVAGTYVMRYLDSREVLAEGIFTLVR